MEEGVVQDSLMLPYFLVLRPRRRSGRGRGGSRPHSREYVACEADRDWGTRNPPPPEGGEGLGVVYMITSCGAAVWRAWVWLAPSLEVVVLPVVDVMRFYRVVPTKGLIEAEIGEAC